MGELCHGEGNPRWGNWAASRVAEELPVFRESSEREIKLTVSELELEIKGGGELCPKGMSSFQMWTLFTARTTVGKPAVLGLETGEPPLWSYSIRPSRHSGARGG